MHQILRLPLKLSIILSVIVNIGIAQPVAQFSTLITFGCAPLEVGFINTSINAIHYQWDLGNGTFSTVIDPATVYTTPGTYTVKLIAISTVGIDSIEMINYITVYASPVADFTVNLTGVCSNDNIAIFSNISTGATSYLWDLGDGNTNTLSNPIHNYTSAGTHLPLLIATNTHGCIDIKIASMPIIIQPLPQIAIDVDTNTTCDVSHVFNFLGNTVGSTAWQWNFDDGTTATVQNPSKVYSASGSYNVSLIATSAMGCADTLIQPNLIRVNPPINVSFSQDITQGCVPQPVAFSVDSGTFASVTWDLGDGTSGTGYTISHNYLIAGNYNVQVEVIDSNGCQTSITTSNAVIVHDIPVPQFVISDTLGCKPLPIDFTNLSSGTYSYNWDMGDGSYDTTENPSHLYTTVGYFYPQLTITDNFGCSGSLQFGSIHTTSTISSFTADVRQGCAPLVVQFTATTTGTAVYHWDFGDGTSSTQANPLHTYTNYGTYDVALISLNSAGCFDKLSIPAYIEVINPEINFTNTDTITACAPYNVQFTSNGLGNTAWSWNLGDGTISTDQDPIHAYTTSGSYNVSLTSYTPDGCMFTIDDYALVNIDTATVDFSYVMPGCTSPTINFSDSSSNISSWSWNFGDGTSSTSQSPVHEYDSMGTFLVSLTVTSTGGCQATQVYPVTAQCFNGGSGPVPVSAPGNGSISYDYNVTNPNHLGCIPVVTQLWSPYLGYASYYWNLGDGTTSTDINPVHSYTAVGNYNIVHFATDSSGNVDTLIIINYLTVGDVTASFGFSQYNTCSNALINYTDLSNNAVSWNWDMGDGTVDTVQNPNHSFPLNNSVYFTSLTVADAVGCSSSVSTAIYTLAPDISFIYDSVLCFGSSLVVQPISQQAYSYIWDFGDGSVSTDTVGFHVYVNPGTYTVQVQVSDTSGCVRLLTLDNPIKVIEPIATFSAIGQTDICLGTQVDFMATDTLNDSYKWTFEQGVISYGQGSNYQYDSAGVFDVILKVSLAGCYATDTISQYITVFEPYADFTMTQSADCFPVTVQYTDNSVDAVSWLWNFGDGNISTSQNPNHVFTTEPWDDVTLSIVDSHGCTDADTLANITLLKASFTVSDTAVCTSTQVDFLDLSNAAVYWQWSFGDGTNSSLQNPSHIYTNSGVYDVSLIVSSSSGCSDTLSYANYISTYNVQAGFTFNSVGTCSPIIVNYSNSSIDATSASWDLGDGSTSTVFSPNHIYSTPGTYYPKLIATNSVGCTDTLVSPTPAIVQGPIADFTFTGGVACKQADVQFSNTTTNGASYVWHFGDGTISTSVSPLHNYMTVGMFNVMLRATDSIGCIDYKFFPNAVDVHPNPETEFDLSDTLACNNTTIIFDNNSTGITSSNWEFGDATSDTIFSPSHLYYTPGNYNITLITTNVFGCTDSAMRMLEILPNAVATIVPVPAICDNSGLVQLTAAQGGGSWSGVGITDTIAGIFNPLSGLGIHNIIYTISGLCGDIDSLNITVQQSYDATIDAVVPLCNNSSAVQLTTANSGGIWTGNGINTSTGIFDPMGLAQGDYNITYTISGQCGDTSTIFITVLPAPVLDFSVNTLGICAQITVDFVNNSNSPSGTTYTWFVNGNQESTDSNPSLQLEAGLYDVSVFAVAPNGCQSSLEKDSIVRIFSTDTLAAPKVIRSTVLNDESVYTEWGNNLNNEVELQNFIMFRSEDGVNFNYINSFGSDQNSYTDFDVDVAYKQYTYFIVAENHCNVASSNSGVSSSVLLDHLKINDYTTRLHWTPYKEWEQGVAHYEIQKLDVFGNWQTIKVVDGSTTEIDLH